MTVHRMSKTKIKEKKPPTVAVFLLATLPASAPSSW